MAIDNDLASAQAPATGGYGRLIREHGTVKVVLLAVVLIAAWYTYDTVSAHILRGKHWPALTADAKGLTVLGLRDKDRPGWKHKYEAIERGHAWIFRRPDDLDTSEEDSAGKGDEDRGTAPGQTHHVSAGEIVDISQIMADPSIPVVLTSKHFTGASIEERTEPLMDRHYYVVTLNLTPEGRSRYWQYSSAHAAPPVQYLPGSSNASERLVFVLDGQPLTCPRMDSMDTSTLEIQPIWDRADADKLASFVNGQK